MVGVVAELQREPRQRRRKACGVRVVEGLQFVQEDPPRHVVAHDVVHADQQVVLVRCGSQQPDPHQRALGEVVPVRAVLLDVPGRLVLVRDVDRFAPRRHVLVHHRNRVASLLGERRAEHGVTAHDLLDRAAHRGLVQFAAQDHGVHRVVAAVLAVDPARRPHPLLDRRRHRLLRVRCRPDRLDGGSAGVGLVEKLRQRADRRTREQVVQGDVAPEVPVQPGQQLGGQQRMPAECEEVRGGADVLHPEDVAPDGRQPLFRRCGRLRPWRVFVHSGRRAQSDAFRHGGRVGQMRGDVGLPFRPHLRGGQAACHEGGQRGEVLGRVRDVPEVVRCRVVACPGVVGPLHPHIRNPSLQLGQPVVQPGEQTSPASVP